MSNDFKKQLESHIHTLKRSSSFGNILDWVKQYIPFESLSIEMVEILNPYLEQFEEEERLCSLGNTLWHSPSLEVLPILQIFRVFEVRRMSSDQDARFRAFCESHYASKITKVIISYKDEDEDWIDWTPLCKSIHFRSLKSIVLRNYPVSEEEREMLRQYKRNFPQLTHFQEY